MIPPSSKYRIPNGIKNIINVVYLERHRETVKMQSLIYANHIPARRSEKWARAAESGATNPVHTLCKPWAQNRRSRVVDNKFRINSSDFSYTALLLIFHRENHVFVHVRWAKFFQLSPILDVSLPSSLSYSQVGGIKKF